MRLNSLCGYVTVLGAACLSLAHIARGAEQTPQRPDRHVVLISVDGLPAYLLDDPQAALPTIRRLAAQGIAAEGMTVSNPSVTWPNHTSLTTGVRPAKHGVLFNGVLVRTGPGLPVRVDPKRDRQDLVRVPTIYDALHVQGLTTAAINWPCTRNVDAIEDNFPDVPDAIDHATPRLIEELQAGGAMTPAEVEGFAKLSVTVKDRIWTEAVCHVIRKRKPNLVLFHPLNVDAVHHRYGPQTPAGYSAVALADRLIADVVQAIDAAGIREQTTILIVSDHGFIAIPQTLQPNVVLRQEKLLTVENNQVTAARVQTVPEGGIAMVYLTVPDDRDGQRRKIADLFREKEGIADVLLPDKFAELGLPQPDDYEQMADLILVAQDGYGFNATATGDDFVVKSEQTLGTHGYLSTNPRMHAVFVASGAGIRKGVKIGRIENIDVSPTIARLLGVPFDGRDGRVVEGAIHTDSQR